MKKIKNGFTLVEVLASLAIVAAIGAVIVFSINKINKKTHDSENVEKYREIFNAASIFSELSENGLNIECAYSCTFTLNDLIEEGLLNKQILKENNPVYGGNRLFLTSDSITITRLDGVKTISYNSGSCQSVTNINYEDYEWGKC